MDLNYYLLSEEEVLKELGATVEGLTNDEAKDRLKIYGENILPGKKKVSLFYIILHQFLNPLIYVLLVAALVSLLLKEYSDAGFIFLVLLINAGIGAYQEWQAESKASALQSMIKIMARVRRDGIEKQISSEDLVPGDIVLVESGNRVPADMRIIKGTNLSVEEAALTGESVPVVKTPDKLIEKDLPLGDQTNMVFAGTTVTQGRATAAVVATGLNTEIGQIAHSLTELEVGKAPLVERMEVFSKKISFITILACFVLGVIGYINGIPFSEIFFFIVAIAVSAIPEGLPISMTVALSIGTSRMARRNVIVRKLSAVEGLGSCTFIATDKTGTLTVDQQTVKRIVLEDGRQYMLEGEGYNGVGDIVDANGDSVSYNDSELLKTFINAVIICNEGTLFKKGDKWKHSGDAVDVALLAISYKAGTKPEEIRKGVKVIKEIPFESVRQYSAVFYQLEDKRYVAVKGGLERVLDKTEKSERTHITEAGELLAAQGLRVIAVAGAELVSDPESGIPPLKFYGLAGLIDPLRAEAKAAVDECHQAGVEVAMVTGDHPVTALAIASELDLAFSKEALISGPELKKLKEEKERESFQKYIAEKRIFARVSPGQKQEIVEALKSHGHFVAVTGDGVNDAPALKSGNIGIAMGYGTDVAKDAASIIITDNNFASIAAGIEEGRFTYSNLRKIIYLLLSTGAAEILMVALSLIFQLPLPFLPVQLLWLNLVTNGIQDKSLAFEPGEAQVMKNPPRLPSESIFDKLMVQQILLASAVIALLSFALYFHLINHLHRSVAEARNMTLLLMVLLQNFHLFNCRSEMRSAFSIPLSENIFLTLGALGAQGIHILAMHIPFMKDLLGIHPIDWHEWIKLLGMASIVLIVMEVFKWQKRVNA